MQTLGARLSNGLFGCALTSTIAAATGGGASCLKQVFSSKYFKVFVLPIDCNLTAALKDRALYPL